MYAPKTRYALKMSFDGHTHTEFFYEGIDEGLKQEAIVAFAKDVGARPDEVGYILHQEEVPIWFDQFRNGNY